MLKRLLSFICTSSVLVYAQNANHITMDAVDKFNVSWSVDNEIITFRIDAMTSGWVGLGFSPTGSMAGSDLIICWVDTNGIVHIEDRYGVSNGFPPLDDSQDVDYVSGSENNGKTSVSFSRMLHTCDTRHDNEIVSSTTRLIYAYGGADPKDNVLTHVDEHAVKGSKSVYLLDNPRTAPALPNDLVAFDFKKDLIIPSATTTYYCSFHKLPDLAAKHHVVKTEPIISSGNGTEPIITPGNEGIVHHILVYACYGDGKLPDSGVCDEMPDDVVCAATIFGWAVGGMEFYYPEHAGVPIGIPEAPDYYLLQTHYDNPGSISQRADASGMKIFYTPTTRQYDAGMFFVGNVQGMFVPPGEKKFKVSSFCFGDCTRSIIPEEGINVFGYLLHSHLLGRAIKVRWFRDGKELEPLAYDDHYDFNYQEFRSPLQELTLLPGDSLRVECTMDSTSRQEITYGGQPTQSEMCLAFLQYYPSHLNISGCRSFGSWHFKESPLWEKLNISLEKVNGSFVPYMDYLSNVTWDDNSRSVAQAVYDEAGQFGSCTTKSSGVTYYEAPVGEKYQSKSADSVCGSTSITQQLSTVIIFTLPLLLPLV